MNITLKTENDTERRVLAYLHENASDVLAEKINAGKKTLAGAIDFAKGEARKLANGEPCVCVDDATVFGWIVHFFEEDHIAEVPKKAKPTVVLPSGVTKRSAPKKAATTKPVEPTAEAPAQLSMMESLFGGANA